MYRKHGLSRVGKTDIQKAINKLDLAFGKMIRARDEDKGCITCGRSEATWHCGHFRPRGAMNTRFDPQNANKQCAYDNIYKDGMAYEHGLAIDRKFGKGTAAALYKKSKIARQWELRQIEQLIGAAKMGAKVYGQLYKEITELSPSYAHL